MLTLAMVLCLLLEQYERALTEQRYVSSAAMTKQDYAASLFHYRHRRGHRLKALEAAARAWLDMHLILDHWKSL